MAELEFVNIDSPMATGFTRRSLCKQNTAHKVGPSILLVSFDEKKKELIVNPKAVELLQEIRKPVAVLSICGPYRSGKSYFVSKFMRSEDFTVSNTCDPCTKGIWMSTSALESKDCTVIALDTEGTGAAQASEASSNDEITKYLIITSLISSFLIYNTQGVITQDHLLQMSHFAELSKRILISKSQEQGALELQKYFPDFLWLMRDSNLISTNKKGEQISSTDYIHQKILVTTGNKPLSKRDKVVEAISSMFPKIECRQISHPGSGINNPRRDIEPDFLEQMNSCIQYILSNIRPKRGFNPTHPLSGQIVALLLEEYVKCINQPGGIPNLEENFQTATDTALQHKIIELSQAYMAKMDTEEKHLPMEEGDIEVLESFHSSQIEEALRLEKVGDDAPLNIEEQTTLFHVHISIYSHMLKNLASEVHRWIPAANLEIEPQVSNVVELRRRSVLEQYQDKIIKTEHGMVTGGLIQGYIRENMNKSTKICEKVFESIFQQQKTCDLISLEKLSSDYHNDKRVKGPAKDEVFTTLISEIPGPPKNLCVQCITDQTLTITWNKASVNTDAAVSYEIFVYTEKSGSPQHHLKHKLDNCLEFIISNLKPVTQYQIKVRGVNNVADNKPGEYCKAITAKTKAGKPDQPEQPSRIVAQTATEGYLFFDMLSKPKHNGSPVTHVIVIRDNVYSSGTEAKSSTFSHKIMASQGDHQCLVINIKCEKDEKALTFKIQFENEAGVSEPSKSVSLYQEDMIPGIPENVQPDCEMIKAREIEVNWDSPKVNPAAVRNYCVQYWAKPNDNQKVSPKKSINSTSRSVVILGLNPKTKYIICVCAKNEKGKNGEYSKQTEVETLAAVPNKPQINSIKAFSPSNAIISFCKQSPEEENGSPVKTVRVQQFIRNESNWTYLQPLDYPLVVCQSNLDVYEIPINLVSLTEDITTSYRVLTVNEIGESEPSQQVDLHPDKIIPGSVEALEMSDVTSSSVKLHWKEPTLNPITVKLYEVKYKREKDSNWHPTQRDPQKDANSEYISTEITSLNPCTKYQFTVLARNGNKASPECCKEVETSPSVPPTPRTPSLYPNGDKFALEVSLPAIEESGRETEKILVYYYNEKGEKINDDHLVNEFSVDLSNVQQQEQGTKIYKQTLEIDIDKAYWITIRLENEIGPSKFESEKVGIATGDVTPGVPNALGYKAYSRQVKLLWKAPKTHGNAAKLYQIYQIDEQNYNQLIVSYKQATEVSGPPTYEATIPGLTPCKEYKFAVRAVNNISNEHKLGELERISVLTEKAPPEKPSPPFVTPIKNNPLKAEVVFTVLSEEHINGNILESAIIEIFNKENEWTFLEESKLKPENLSQPLKVEVELFNLKDETITSYKFRVKMKNECHESDPSEEFLLPVSQLQPGKPQSLTVSEETAHTLKLTWEKPDVHPAIVRGYTLECLCENDLKTRPIVNLSSQSHQFIVENLKSNQKYTIKVSALAHSSSLPAIVEKLTQIIYPSAPINLYTEKIGDTRVKIRWSKPKNNPAEVLFYYVELREGDYSQVFQKNASDSAEATPVQKNASDSAEATPVQKNASDSAEATPVQKNASDSAEATPVQKNASDSAEATQVQNNSQNILPKAKQTRQTKGHSTVFKDLNTFTLHTVSVSSHNDNKQKGESATACVTFRTKLSGHSRRALQAAVALPTFGMGAVALQYSQTPDAGIVCSDEEYHDPNAYPSAPEITSIKVKHLTKKVKIKWNKPAENPDELRNKNPYFLEVREGECKATLEQDPEASLLIVPKYSFLVNSLSYKVPNLETDMVYTFSVTSYNYLDKKGGTTHKEFEPKSKYSKPRPDQSQDHPQQSVPGPTDIAEMKEFADARP